MYTKTRISEDIYNVTAEDLRKSMVTPEVMDAFKEHPLNWYIRKVAKL